MKRRFLLSPLAAVVRASRLAYSAPVHAQGVTTGGVTGIVTDDAGQPVEAAQVQLRNAATGRTVGALTRANGQYLIQGVEPDANYSLTVRRIGFEPQTRDASAITLNQTRREDFKLSHQVARPQCDPGRRDDRSDDQRNEDRDRDRRLRFGAASSADAESQLL